jgi:hypothetical protein
VTDDGISYIEIYPKIFVYKNLFKDISKTTSLLEEEDEGGLFSPWTQWAQVGQYLDPLFKDHKHNMTMEYMEKEVETNSPKQEEQKSAILEIFKNFHLATKHYMNKHNVDFDEEAFVTNRGGETNKLWTIMGPSIARYRTDLDRPWGLAYHSDYKREPIKTPGDKFVITALTYFNDDYKGGGLHFREQDIMYTPKAGDVVIFPSTYMYPHRAMPVEEGTKYSLVTMLDYSDKYHDPKFYQETGS